MHKEGKKTKANTLAAFIELYTGPEFMIHYKHSYIMNAIFLTMFYGPSIPILFPITFVKLVAFYAVERYMMAYGYRRPPMYDTSINKNTIKVLSWAPILYTFSAALFFSNKQLFGNAAPLILNG